MEGLIGGRKMGWDEKRGKEEENGGMEKSFL